MSEVLSGPLLHSGLHMPRTSDRKKDPMRVARAAARALSVKPRIVPVGGVEVERGQDLHGPA